MFALKLALRPWRLQPVSQFLSFATLSVLLLLAGFFASLAFSLPAARKGLEGDQVASVFLDPAAEPGQLEAVRDQIRLAVGASPIRVEYVDSDAFLETMRREQPELAKEIAALGTEKEWIVPKHFSLRGAIGERLVERVRAIAGVENVAFSARRFKPIVENLAAVEWLARALFAAIGLAMVAVLALLGRLNSSIFAEAEAIVSQMGGGAWQSGFPARLNPVLLSGAAGLLAALLFLKLHPWFAAKMASLSPYFSGLAAPAPYVSAPMLFLFGCAMGGIAFLLSPRAEAIRR